MPARPGTWEGALTGCHRQLSFGAMLVQLIQGGSGTLRTDYPGIITLVAAFFFPVGLVRDLLALDTLPTMNTE